MKFTMKFLVILSVSLVLGCASDPAAPPNDPGDSAWTTYTTTGGLPHGSVTGLEVGPDGSLWFNHAIEGGGGVTHFDGTTFTHYDESNGLPTNAVLWYGAIAVQSNGDVWIGSFENGVMHFDGENWTTQTMVNGLGGDNVIAVTVAPNGDVWCIGDGISCYNGEEWSSWSVEALGLAPFAFSVEVCADGEVWVGGDGMTRFDGQNHRHFSPQEMGLNSSGDYGIGSVAIDDDGIVWAATSGQGIVRFDGTEWTRLTSASGLLDDGAFSVAMDHEGALWVGSNGGLSRYVPTNQD